MTHDTNSVQTAVEKNVTLYRIVLLTDASV